MLLLKCTVTIIKESLYLQYDFHFTFGYKCNKTSKLMNLTFVVLIIPWLCHCIPNFITLYSELCRNTIVTKN